jgi:anti-sigma regulatory factor (Ser/Thr protein kinase)
VLGVRGKSMASAVEFLGRPTSVRNARVFIGGTLANDGVEVSVIDVAELLVSELVTNAVVHARGTIRLTIHTDAHCVRIEVEDQGHGCPVLRPPTKGQRDGRGLQMVDELATDWEPNAAQPTRSSGSRSLARERGVRREVSSRLASRERSPRTRKPHHTRGSARP